MSNTIVAGEGCLIPASITSEKVKSSNHVHNKSYYYSKKRTHKKKTRNAHKAAGFDVVSVSKFALDEFQTAGYIGGLKLELKDKDDNIIDRIRLADEQGKPLVSIML